ncbi:MAG: hypothetical protein ACK46X_20745, partial [Candidatus Sericytochromatia bacterium]
MGLSCRRAALASLGALGVVAISGCVPPRALATAPVMAFGMVPEAPAMAPAVTAARTAGMSAPLAEEAPLAGSPGPAVAPPAILSPSGGAAAPAPAVFDPTAGHWWLPGGQRLATADADAVAVPCGVVGLVSLRGPQRV